MREKQNTYRQVKDVLTDMQRLHGLVEDLCNRQRPSDGDDIVAELLKRFGTRADAIRVHVADAVADTPAGVLETWVQYPESDSLAAAADALAAGDNLSAQDALERILAAERSVIETLQLLARETNSHRLDELFQTLLLMEEQSSRAGGNDVAQLQDLRSLDPKV